MPLTSQQTVRHNRPEWSRGGDLTVKGPLSLLPSEDIKVQDNSDTAEVTERGGKNQHRSFNFAW